MHQDMINQMRQMICNLQKQNKETADQKFNQNLVLNNVMFISNHELGFITQRIHYSFMIYIVIFSLTSDLDSTTETNVKNKVDTSPLMEKSDLEKDFQEEWSEETAIQEFPTNAVGEIHFINEDEGSIKPSK